jgi:hypothetical protein
MKRILAQIAIFCKRPSFIYRLIGIVGAAGLVFGVALPDIKFNMSADKSISMTLDQLIKTPTEEIPRYLKIKDAVVPSGSYVEFRSGKQNALSGIYYPVYPSAEVKFDIKDTDKLGGDSAKVILDSTGKLSLMKHTDNMNSKLVIHDTHVTDADLDSTGKYFNNPTFSIEGQYDGDKLGEDVLNLFSESGLNVSPDAIVLNRGNKGMGTFEAIFATLAGLFVMLICILSFVPESKLRTWM